MSTISIRYMIDDVPAAIRAPEKGTGTFCSADYAK
jgi:hypothetical protein